MVNDEPFVELPESRPHRKRPCVRPRPPLKTRHDLNSLESDVEHDPMETVKANRERNHDHEQEHEYTHERHPEQDEVPPWSRFEEAKRFFHRSAAVRIVGRTAERAFIEKFWREAWREGSASPAVLYMCGNPGSGKTALITEMLPELCDDDADEMRRVQVVKTNCMMFNDPRETLQVIAKELHIKERRPRSNRTADRWTELLDSIEEAFKGSRGSSRIALVLDEIDQIALCDAALLERIFNWPYLAEGLRPARVVVIGIANALDLSIRHGCGGGGEGRVAVLNFVPYSPEDIARILMARLEMANAAQQENRLRNRTPTRTEASSEIISPMAVEMCARKVSAVGDLRRALEIMQEALGTAAREHQDNQQGKVEIKHVISAMERVFGTTVRTASRHAQLISELNLHQKLLLAPLCRLLRDSPAVRPTVQTLFERYTAGVRAHRIIDAVSRGEFVDLVTNSESMGVISLVAPGKRVANKAAVGGTVQPDTKVLLALPLEDAIAGLSDHPVLQQLLHP